MSLDQNLFTLNVVPDAQNPAVTDLVDPTGRTHYKKHRVSGAMYQMDVFDPLSEALLASVTAPDTSSKTKLIQLFNPNHVVELKSIGTLSFKWSFKWEDHEFEWKREECFMVRKPDPAVLVAITKEPPGKLQTTAVQILDYNLNRFDIADRKGLEIVLLTALLTFHDLNANFNAFQTSPKPATTPAPSPSSSRAPATPPKPVSNIDRIAQIQAERGEVNEVLVTDECTVDDYAEYAAKLLWDSAMLFITIRSDAAEQVPKVLAVVEETKRIRHKQGVLDDELHQYVVYDNKRRPQRIKLDDPPSGAPPRDYTPPDSLSVHLSKIDMPELKPKISPHLNTRIYSFESSSDEYAPIAGKSMNPFPHQPEPGRSNKQSKKDKDKIKKSKKDKSGPSPPPLPPHSTRPPMIPSPSQLNNPMVYVAEPSTPSRTRTGFWRR